MPLLEVIQNASISAPSVPTGRSHRNGKGRSVRRVHTRDGQNDVGGKKALNYVFLKRPGLSGIP